MSATVFVLPVPLILLVHLHILDYPHANKPEYDHNIFDARVRGLRERTKLLEDICYFLVERLEGSVRTILASYPCLHPSDTIAFRTSLAKYLESLRHRSLYPTSKVTSGYGGKSNRTQTGIANKDAAWWWKDVVVRKSLLEECSGEKFERLLLSISTHVLHQDVSPLLVPALPENASTLLRNQPFIYSDLLSKYNSIRHTWSHAASVLLQCQEDLKSIRERLTSDNGAITSKYTSLETERLVALAGSKFQDLLRDLWRGQEGRRALAFLAELCGLKPMQTATSSHPSQSNLTSHATENNAIAPPPPLPIAAAHHPANLKKIRRPVFFSVNPKPRSKVQHVGPDVTPPKTTRSLAAIALSDRLDAEMRMQQALADALARVKKSGQDLVSRVNVFEAKREVKATGFLLDLWQPDTQKHHPVTFDTQPTPELLSSLALYTPGTERSLDMRIDDIRESMLPPYPPVPDLSAPRPATIETQSFNSESSHSGLSKIPRTTFQSTKAFTSADESTNKSTSYSQQTLEPPRQLVTSTPAVQSRRPVIGQATGKQNLRRGSKVPRKSIRFSLANNRRPSLFAVDGHSDEEGEQEDEVHRIVRGTREGSFEDPHAPVTPKVKSTHVHRIFTGTKGSTVKKPKQSYPMAFHEPPIALPSLVSSSSSFNDLLTDATYDDDGNDDCWMAEQVNGTNRSQDVQRKVQVDADGYIDEGPSMTLRDILLRADTTQFDLLDAEKDEYLDDESFGWD